MHAGQPSTSEAWPAVAYETRPWQSRATRGQASRSLLRRHQGPFRAAVPPPIAARTLTLPAELLATAEEAATEVSRFDAEMGGDVAPFSAVLLRSESAASSQIENLTASARAIAEAELGAEKRANAAAILGNVRAMNAAIELADDVSAESILAMHAALMERTEPAMAGRWRQEQVWIGGSSLGPHEAMFVPPQPDRVRDGVDDLVRFMHRDDLPVLPQAAIAHAQFETIHPFLDGNGRTGRALVHSLLRNKGLVRNVTVPVSAGLLTNTGEYFAALDSYRVGDPGRIVYQLSVAAFAAIRNGRQLVEELRDIRRGWNDRVAARRNSGVWRVADLLLRHPVVNAQLLASELGRSQPNVYRFLELLEQAGVLVEFTAHRRGRVWRSPEILQALDAFAARAGRRAPSA